MGAIREYLMAFVFARKHSRGKTWYVGYYVNGKFVRRRVGRSKAIAGKALGDIEAKLARGEAGLINKDYPILDFFEEYLNRTKVRHSTSYHDRNRRVVKQFKKFLKEKRPYLTRISQLRPDVIEEFQRYRLAQVVENTGKPIKKRTVNIDVSSLKTFLNNAVKWDMISSNPLDGVEYLKEDDSKVIRGLTEEEVRTLLEEANGWFRPVLVTALYTGLREGEMISLEWDDVDLENGIIHIRRKPGWIPKSSGRSIRERDIAIPEQLVDYLKKYRKGSEYGDSRVFHNKFGEELKPGLRKVLMRLTKKCGFPEVTQFHALRHTYATHLIKASKDLQVARDQLGHADIRTTMKYSDMTMERKKKATDMLKYESVEKEGGK
jgi:integrase